MDNLTIHYMLSIKNLCLYTVACPLVSLIFCFITASIFQADEVHEDHCKVYNVVPSISAITGVSPQRYLWRITVAMHIGPRFIISIVNRAYHFNLIKTNSFINNKSQAIFWANMVFWLNIIELSSLCGVTYISNKENYPLHEKFFIIFMFSSLLHMLACIKCIKLIENDNHIEKTKKKLFIKKCLLITSIISAIGMVGFFVEHRIYCHDLAFTKFALCEYVIAIANMAFHITAIMDFPTEYLIVAKGFKFMEDDNKLD